MTNKAVWQRVKDEDELRPGITVELRTCGFCGRRERLVLLRVVKTERPMRLHHSGDMISGPGKGWLAAPGPCLNPRRPLDLSVAIADRRLWRLADADTDESTTELESEAIEGEVKGRARWSRTSKGPQLSGQSTRL